MRIRYFLPLTVFSFLAGLFFYGLKQDPHQMPSALIGKQMPAFSLSTLRDPGEEMTQQEFMGHVSLLNVWATWCISCRVEHPVLVDIARSKQVVVYGLNYKDERGAAQQWLRQFGNPYLKNIYDPEGKLGIDLGVYGTPETFVLDEQGIIRYKYVGPITSDAWHNEILPIVTRLKSDGSA